MWGRPLSLQENRQCTVSFFVIFKLDFNFEIKLSMFYSESVWFAMHRRLEFGENNETRMTVLIIYAENK